ncbi:DUF3788 family protein [Acidobacteria bacterium AB60]|nr:DUF3788 family protein [Acidobacteria bacterium AB60]
MMKEIPNAFLGHNDPPSQPELTEALGAAAPLWQEIVERISRDEHITGQEWNGVGTAKYGWTLRLLHGKRRIAYLSPCTGCFRVAFLLGDRAMKEVGKVPFPAPVRATIAAAPHYPEGTGIRLLVRSHADVPPVLKLAHIKAVS